jgi:choline dehydrogenase-like flavoprotein
MRNVGHGSGIFDHSDPEHYLGVAACLTHALSRGSTHIQSSDVSVHPIIDPRYMSHPADIQVPAQALRVLDAKIVHTEPFASKLKGGKQPMCQEFSPSTSEDFIQNFFSTQWHVLGTCSMLPREDRGVLDPNLKVYGTANLRAIDASVIPLMVQGNIQTAVYAVAEKGADLVETT